MTVTSESKAVDGSRIVQYVAGLTGMYHFLLHNNDANQLRVYIDRDARRFLLGNRKPDDINSQLIMNDGM